MRIGLVAGEASGDMLGAELIAEIRKRHPQAEFEGIAGPRMREQGCRALFESEKLAVMGIFEVLGHLPELLSIRRQVRRHFVQSPPDVFVGIDAPDFNLGLERKLHEAGIRTVHYVSPSVWAWRQGRVQHIAASVDRVLTLFPFEQTFYQQHGVDARCVGHPLADAIPAQVDQAAARRALNLPQSGAVVALLPGSRRSEVQRLAKTFVLTARRCAETRPTLHFVAPMAHAAVRTIFSDAVDRYGAGLNVKLTDGGAQQAIAAADVVLLASGTATLEALLLKRPMVVAYRISTLTYWLVRGLRLLKVPYYSLPNWLCREQVIPEFIQGDARPERLATAVLRWLDHPQDMHALADRFEEVHRSLRRGASARAAEAVLELVGHG